MRERLTDGRLIAGASILVALVVTWPLVFHLGTDFPQEIGDPLHHAWQVAWSGHSIAHPLDVFQSNRLWPERDNLAFSDILLGYAPLGLISAQSPQAALVVLNVLTLFTYALAFAAAALLARELGAGRWGFLAAGAAFACAPWRLAHVRHLNVLSSGGVVLALFLLVRGYRRGSARTVVAGWLVAAWQMTLGFSLGVQFGYLLLVLAVVAGVIWWARGRPQVERGVIVGTVAGVAVLVVVTALLARPYLSVVDSHPEAERSADLVAFFSPSLSSFLTAPPESAIWGDATAATRDSFRWPIEQTLFLGVAIVVLALLGLWSTVYPASLRIGLACGTLATAALSLGLPHYPDGDRGFTPYRILYAYLPGWDGIRTPGRLQLLTSLGLALLAGAGVCLVVSRLRNWTALRDTRTRSVAAAVAAVALIGVIVAEGFGPVPVYAAPDRPAGVADAPDPQFHLPSTYGYDLLYTYWSIGGFPRIVNGAASFEPARLNALRDEVEGFPDASSVRILRDLGVRTVVLHPALAAATPWRDAASRSIAGLGITREEKGDVVLFHLASH